ncbi:MAG: acyltransferase [Microbacterium sp.]|jgi:peptidoglycan/LPS O-acetylase OafA/YrhL|nr:acyltransferase [Microbacterium sp.]
MADSSRAFSTVFDPRANGLNFVRLLLASGVIIWHSFPLTGNDIEWSPLRQIVAEVWVDGFFAASGFLIVGSWIRDPHIGRYLWARLLRILPAFWTCLVVTALVLAPLAAGVFGADNFSYIFKNAALWMLQFDIAGTPVGVPYEGVWNGSIWTLAWEFACYMLVLVVGALGLLRHRATLLALFAVCLAVTAAGSIGITDSWFLLTGARFGIMFLAGALVWQYSDSIRVNWTWAGGATVLLIVSLWLPDYRILAALPLAYLVLAAGAVIKTPRLRLHNDISYGVYIYAFPVQQILALLGLWQLGVLPFAALALIGTVPLALASWFFIEKPALRFKRRRGIVANTTSVAPAAQR